MYILLISILKIFDYLRITQEHQNLWQCHGRKYENSAFKMQEISFLSRPKFLGFCACPQVDTTIYNVCVTVLCRAKMFERKHCFLRINWTVIQSFWWTAVFKVTFENTVIVGKNFLNLVRTLAIRFSQGLIKILQRRW